MAWLCLTEEEGWTQAMEARYSQVRNFILEYSQPPNTTGMLGGTIWVCGTDEVPQIVKDSHITHMINCAGQHARSHAAKLLVQDGGPVQQYTEIGAEDDPEYDILQHLSQVEETVRNAKAVGGKVLFHCAAGLNRSVALCCGYLVKHEHMDLLEAVSLLCSQRGYVLGNNGFKRQLVVLELECKEPTKVERTD
eukprot:TRINITY_DN69167_c0_g1_i1.p1 TRINITY_DN69167_c0_g1~~TRINITY_DN69167_c0_g1_i1.p1  ORF type:complete len:193 (+),score=15.29 TRINITY_DN69167_c0_g1_i1:23-601(+)